MRNVPFITIIGWVAFLAVFAATALSAPAYADCVQSTTSQDPTHAAWDASHMALDPACLSDPAQAEKLIGPVISWAIGLFLIAGAVGAIAMFVFGGYKFMMSEGDPGKVAEARKTMLYAAAGVLITSAVYLVIIFYNSVFPKAQ